MSSGAFSRLCATCNSANHLTLCLMTLVLTSKINGMRCIRHGRAQASAVVRQLPNETRQAAVTNTSFQSTGLKDIARTEVLKSEVVVVRSLKIGLTSIFNWADARAADSCTRRPHVPRTPHLGSLTKSTSRQKYRVNKILAGV